MKLWVCSLLVLFASRGWASAVTIITTSLPSGKVGTAYSATIQASGGCLPYKWGIVSGSLPAGVTAKASSTTTSLNLTGTPTTATTYSPTVQVTACGGGTFKASYKVLIQANTSLMINTTSLPSGKVGTAYSATIQASGGCLPYKWNIVSGSLPAGVKATASSTTTSLNLSGTPTTAATYYPTVQVTGCGGGTFKASYKIVVQASTSALTISTTSLPNGIVGSAYSAVVKASGGCTPYKWSIVSGALPAGVKATASSTTTSFNLTGTPTTAATYYPTVQVTGCGGGTFKASYKIVVQASTSALTISTTSLPNGIVASAYSAVVKAGGGCTPYKWSIVSGALPAGVKATASSTTTSLNLSGTPTTAATYYPTVQVTSCSGSTFKDSYKVVVQAATNHVVDLSWKASTSTDVAGYNMYRSPDGSTWKKLNASLIASTLYSDATVANGSTYYYSATAVDIYGHESSRTTPVKVSIP